jgi:hypothetical protein
MLKRPGARSSSAVVSSKRHATSSSHKPVKDGKNNTENSLNNSNLEAVLCGEKTAVNDLVGVCICSFFQNVVGLPELSLSRLGGSLIWKSSYCQLDRCSTSNLHDLGTQPSFLRCRMLL